MNGIPYGFRAKPRAGFGNSPNFFNNPLHIFDGTLFIIVALVLLLTCGRPARAQDLDEVSFSGTVADERGAVIRGAAVTARLLSTGAVRAGVTDAEGRYRLIELAPGAYLLRAEAAGFAAEERGAVSAAAGQAVRLDFRLRPAGVTAEQTILSEAAAPAVDTARTVTGGAVSREEIERLPVFTRSPLDLVFLLGGVTEEPLPHLYS